MNGWLDDLRFAVRALRARPGFVVAAVLTLALGIGANTAIFSITNAFLLKPLPYPDGERLVEIHNSYPGNDLLVAGVSVPDYIDRREQADALADTALYTGQSFNLAADGRPERLLGLMATPSLFSTLQIDAAIGRTFSEEAAVPGNDQQVVLSHRVWRNRFNADPGIVGSDVRLNGRQYRIVGVMPEGFAFPNRDIDLYVPFAFTPELAADEGRGREFSSSIGRLKPGATIAQLNAQMDAIVLANRDRFAALGERGVGYAEFLERAGFTGRAQTFREYLVGDMRTTLIMLQAVVIFVLLIACANVANLMLARVLGRMRELAMRAAVGAKQSRVARQLVLEGVLLGIGGGIVGLGLSWLVIQLVGVFGIDSSAQHFDIAIDPFVLLFAFLLAVFAGAAFSLLSVASAARLDIQKVVKEGQGQTADRGSQFARGALVSLQVALAAALLIGAGLMLRSFEKLQNESPGFEPRGVVAMMLELSSEKYEEQDARQRFFDGLLNTLQAQPGIESAAIVSELPFSNDNSSASYRIQDHPSETGSGMPHGYSRYVSSDYFHAMEIPLLRGRFFDPSIDRPDSPPVAIIDAVLARKHFSDKDPIGQRISNGRDSEGNQRWATVVGVVGAIKHDGLNDVVEKETYYHYVQQRPPAEAGVIVKTSLPPAVIDRQLRETVLAVDPEQPVHDLRAMDERIRMSLDAQRAPMLLLTLFSVVAVLLAVVGIYGVLSYSIGQRTTELGVRMALGAQAGNVLGLVLAQGARFVGIGIIAGVAAALALTRFLASMLFGISTFDPLTFLLAPTLLLAVGMFACSVPAWRATRISPMRALRYD